jgi:2-aminoadipate transaminase
MKRSFIREILEHVADDTISFAGGLPDPSLFPVEGLRQAAEQTLAKAEVYQYSISLGLPQLRELISQWYSDRGFPTKTDEILITSGSQQALDIISRYHSNCAITVESPSYLGALNLFDLNRLRTEPIPLHSEGIDLSSFKKSVQKTRLAYLIPDFQNPTGYRYTHEHRSAIAKYCMEHKALLIEDAPYSALYFDTPMPSISQSIPSRSYHLGTLSKILAPGLRIGWIRADRSLLQPLIAYKESCDLHTSTVTQFIALHYLQDSESFKRQLQQLRNHYRMKMEHFAHTLRRELPNFHFVQPAGGLFLYGNLPGIDTSELLHRCLQKRVLFVPGIEFGGAAEAIRFNYSYSSLAEIKEGISRIKMVLAENFK